MKYVREMFEGQSPNSILYCNGFKRMHLTKWEKSNVHVELNGGNSKTFQVGASEGVKSRLLEEYLNVPENDPGVNL